MHRIDTPNNNDGLFQPPDPPTRGPVVIDSPWLNDLQENICQFIEYMGIALVKGDYTQLRKAILAAAGSGYVLDTGAPNALVGALTTPPSALENGFTVIVHVANTTTGAATFNLDGFGADPILINNRALDPGALQAGTSHLLCYLGGNWQLLSQPFKDWQRQPGAGNYTFAVGDHERSFYHSDAGTPIYTLPTGTGLDDGWRVRLINDASAGAITLQADPADELWWLPAHTLGSRTIGASAYVDIEHVTQHQFWIRGFAIS